MKKIIIFYLFLLLFIYQVFSQKMWELKGGFSYSNFENLSNSSPNYGLILGISRKFNLKWNFFIRGEIDFAMRNATLNDRSIKPYERFNKSEVFLWNIHLKLGFVDIPILIQYLLPLKSEPNVIIFTGPSFSIPILDFSTIEKKKFYEEYDPNNPNSTEYDFWFGDGERNSAFWSNDLKVIYNFGLNLSYSKYIVEFRYVLDTRNVYRIDNISDINNGINSIYILLGIGI